MSCIQTIQDYALRSVGLGERLLPKIRLYPVRTVHADRLGHDLECLFRHHGPCDWLLPGHRPSRRQGIFSNKWLRKPSEWFIFLFRGSPLFIQFFFRLLLLPVAEEALSDVRRPDRRPGWARIDRVCSSTQPRTRVRSSMAPSARSPRVISRLQMPMA